MNGFNVEIDVVVVDDRSDREPASYTDREHVFGVETTEEGDLWLTDVDGTICGEYEPGAWTALRVTVAP